jgi:hypothetical protein
MRKQENPQGAYKRSNLIHFVFVLVFRPYKILIYEDEQEDEACTAKEESLKPQPLKLSSMAFANALPAS